MQVRAYRRQYGASYISAMPTNLYGPGDNFDLETSHVLPALIRRFHEAERDGPRRGRAVGQRHAAPRVPARRRPGRAPAPCCCASTTATTPVNVGCGEDLTIRELAETVRDVVGYRGRIAFDTSQPDGTPRKLLDVSRLRALGFAPRIALADGIRATYRWWLRTGTARPQPRRRPRPGI